MVRQSCALTKKLSILLTAMALLLPVPGPAAAAELWSGAGSLATARYDHTAAVLDDGKILVAGGAGNSGLLASAELYDPATNTWSPAGSLADARYVHTATTLANGKVLVTGGESPSGRLASAELYDATTNAWSPAGSLADARYHHTATRLANGNVLVTGGYGNGGLLASAELYNPATNTWSSAGSLSQARRQHTATALADGKVLVAGGHPDGPGALASAELYDATTNTWSPAGSMGTARDLHTASILHNGNVLVAGGMTGDEFGDPLASAELYDATTNTWSPAGPLAGTRYQHTATTLADGQVLVAGGHSNSPYLASAELYDAITNTWSPTGSMATARFDHTGTALHNGKILVAGGNSGTGLLTSAELYDFAWTDSDGDGIGDHIDNCPSVGNASQGDGNEDGQGDLCEETHQRFITLSFKHVRVDGVRKLKLSGDLSVADTASRCAQNRRVFLERYNRNTKKWIDIAEVVTGDGDYAYNARHVASNYRASVTNHKVNYDGFPSVCSAASTTNRHSH